jgi:protein O-GlcNAc transferase
LDLEPGDSRARYELAIVLQTTGRLEEALAACQAVLDVSRDFLEAYVRLANPLRARGRLEEALRVCGEAARRGPRCAEAYIEAGMALRILGRIDQAVAAYRRASELEPQSFAAHWYLSFSALRLMYRSVEEIEATRLTYDRNLEALARECRATDEAGRRRAADFGRRMRPVFLTYQGKNDRELQRRYGVLIAELMQQRCPRFSRRPQMPPVGPGGLIQVGFASSFFFRHSNWKIPIKGWVENPDLEGFELMGTISAANGTTRPSLPAQILPVSPRGT